MKKSVLLTLCILSFIVSLAQKQERVFKDKRGHHHKMGNIHSRVGVFVNPLGPVEFQEGAAGLGLNLMLARRWDISGEFSFLYQGWGEKTYDRVVLNGFRAVMTIKRLSYSRVFFYGLDLRLKRYNTSDQLSFINASLPDTLSNFNHEAMHTLYGVGGTAGLRLPLSKNRKWAMELSLGIGVKYRQIRRNKVPAGYTYWELPRPVDINFYWQQNYEGWTPYVPGGLRIMYLF
ncbi:MAG: DUF3575 domain-containing protein [Ferruginibacter sp.]